MSAGKLKFLVDVGVGKKVEEYLLVIRNLDLENYAEQNSTTW